MKQFLFLLTLLSLMLPLHALEEGEAAARFANPDREGTYLLSKNVIGNGWVILDFFATDCEGCIKELPELEALHEEFGEAGLSVIVFAVDEEGADVVNPWFVENPTPLTVVLDRFKTTALRYGVEEIPAVFLVNPEGIIVLRQIAYAEENIAVIRKILSEALGGEDEGGESKVPYPPETNMGGA